MTSGHPHLVHRPKSAWAVAHGANAHGRTDLRPGGVRNVFVPSTNVFVWEEPYAADCCSTWEYELRENQVT